MVELNSTVCLQYTLTGFRGSYCQKNCKIKCTIEFSVDIHLIYKSNVANIKENNNKLMKMYCSCNNRYTYILQRFVLGEFFCCC